ncbi:MAG TPA: 50S ribosomal protein L5, partial [Coriobacteriia bacterium]|nr:50S ribosomal protein L5 [Coriobacteriia bacterium]
EGRALLKALGFPFKAPADEPTEVAKKKRPAFTGKKKK